MTQHTPGPWAINYRDGDMPYIVADQGKAWNDPIVCALYDDVTPEDSVTIGPWLEAHPNAEANARLIAAAPKLLYSAEFSDKEIGKHMAAIEAGEYGFDLIVEILVDIQNAARAAIAQAKGE